MSALRSIAHLKEIIFDQHLVNCLCIVALFIYEYKLR